MSMFFTSRKTVFKSWLDTSSIASYLSSFLSFFFYRNLANASTPGGSIEIESASSIASWYLVDRSRFSLYPRQYLDTWWIDRAFVLDVDELFLDTFSTPQLSMNISSTDTSTPLNTFICRDLLAFLYKPHVWSGNHASDDVDGDATDEMSTWHSCPLSLVTKRGSSFVMRVVYLRERVSIRPFLLGGVLILFEGCSEDNMYLFIFFLFLDTLLLYIRSCNHL